MSDKAGKPLSSKFPALYWNNTHLPKDYSQLNMIYVLLLLPSFLKSSFFKYTSNMDSV